VAVVIGSLWMGGMLGCDGSRDTRESPDAAAPASEGEKADTKAKNEGVPDKYQGIELAEISDGVVRLDAVLGKSPEEVETLLGKPTAFSEQPVSCVRFLPDRVFFKCEHAMAVYAAPEDKAEQIEIEYEDGKARAVSFSGLVGSGDFEAARALEMVGLSLPGEPKIKHPEFVDRSAQKEDATVDLYSWWNGEARLIVDGQEHRVEVSVVNGEWARSKVKVINNHPLSEDQKARIKTPKGGAPEGGATEMSEP
jgi:hypothetical protein